WEAKKGGGKKGPEFDGYPVLGLSGRDAAAFARLSLRGALPSVDQWDKAAGRFEKPRPWEGPYKGNWKEGRKDIGIGRPLQGPIPLAEATGDVSEAYGCKNMAANGYEWTSTPSMAGDRNVLILRSRSYTHELPLSYEIIEKGDYIPTRNVGEVV